MTNEKMVELTWTGPDGHVSKTWGVLQPGQTYRVTVEQAQALLRSDYWQAPVEPARRRKDGED